MKKSKFTLVIVLGLVLCLLCGTTTTFSWFNRPDVQKGDSLSWHGDYNVTNGKNITAVTYAALKPDGSEYSAVPFDFKTPTTVPAHETKYFCTEVKNTGTAPQSISLFLNLSETSREVPLDSVSLPGLEAKRETNSPPKIFIMASEQPSLISGFFPLAVLYISARMVSMSSIAPLPRLKRTCPAAVSLIGREARSKSSIPRPFSIFLMAVEIAG